MANMEPVDRKRRDEGEAAVYRIDGDPATDGTLAEFQCANDDFDSEAEVMRGLAVGESFVIGGGAAAAFVVERVK